MFPATKAQHNDLKKAFLKTMDNKRGNDFSANQDIQRLAATMSDSEINTAFAAARDEAKENNSKKKAFGGKKYKNVDSNTAFQARNNADQANNWQNFFPGLMNFLHMCGCR